MIQKPTMPATTVDISELAFAPVLTTSKGSKQLPALFKDGSPVTWQADSMEIPFEPSAFGDAEAVRVTLCLNPTESVCATIAAIDEWCIKTLSANPTSLIGIQLTPDQVRERYTSALKHSDKGYKTLRLKMNRAGRYALQLYTPEKERRCHPDAWRGCRVQPLITLKGLWLMNKDFGPLLKVQHAILEEGGHGDDCPF